MTLINKIIPIFFEESKCPFNCTFCNTQTANGLGSEFKNLNEMKEQIETALKTISKNDNLFLEIAFFGGSFTCCRVDEIEDFLNLTEQYVRNGDVNGIRISTRPDFFNDEMIKILKKYTITTVEFGVQSFNDNILNTLKRGHSSEDAVKAVKKSLEQGYKTSVHLMCGLPDESEGDFLYSIKKTIELKPTYVRIHPLVVMKNTMLEKIHYHAPSCDEILERLAKGVWLLERNDIKVIKLGLQPTDSLNERGSVLSGCYHQSLKHLVYSFIYRTFLNTVINNWGCDIEIEICSRDQSYFSGYKKNNCDILNRFKNVVINDNLETNEVIVNKMKVNILSEELYEVD